MTERWFSVWQQSDLDFDAATLAASTSSMAIVGLVEEEQVIGAATRPDAKLLGSWPNARFAFHRERDRDAEFELVVRALIEGLHTRLLGAVHAIQGEEIS